MLVAGPAWGIAYGTLRAYGGGHHLASDHGHVYHSTSNGDRMAVGYHTDDTYANSHAAVTKVYWYFNGSHCYPNGPGTVGCGSGWYGDGRSEGKRTYSYYHGHLYNQLKATANSARAAIEVCEDQGTLHPDDCSPRAIRGFQY